LTHFIPSFNVANQSRYSISCFDQKQA